MSFGFGLDEYGLGAENKQMAQLGFKCQWVWVIASYLAPQKGPWWHSEVVDWRKGIKMFQ